MQDGSTKRGWLQPAGLFLVLGLISGLLILVLLPPMQVADEWPHFYRAYLLTEGRWLGEGMGDTVPKELHRLTKETMLFMGIRSRAPVPWEEMKDFLSYMNTLQINDQEREYVPFATVMYAPLPYAGMTAAIAVGKLWNASPLALMYLGRLGGLLLALGITYYAIRVAPFGKWAFFLIAMTPVILFQRAGMSADGFLNAMAMLYVCLVLRETSALDRPMASNHIVQLGIVTVILCLCKQAYLAMPLLNWIIPFKRFARAGDRRAVLYGLPMLGWASAVWWATTVMRRNYTPIIQDSDAMGQLVYILTNPLKYALVLTGDLVTNGHEYLHQLIGTLGWLNITAQDGLVWTQAAMLLIISILDGRPSHTLRPLARAWAATITLLSVTLVWTLMYLWWAPVGASTLIGMQGRYFTPLLALFPAIFSLPVRNDSAINSRGAVGSDDLALRLLAAVMGVYALILTGDTIWRMLAHHYQW